MNLRSPRRLDLAFGFDCSWESLRSTVWNKKFGFRLSALWRSVVLSFEKSFLAKSELFIPEGGTQKDRTRHGTNIMFLVEKTPTL